MTALKFSIVEEFRHTGENPNPPVIVVGAAKADGVLGLVGSEAFTTKQLESLGVTGKAETVTRSLGSDGYSYAILGLGSAEPSADKWRELGGAIGRSLMGEPSLVLELEPQGISEAEALLQGILLGAYEVANKKKKTKLGNVTLVTKLSLSKARIKAIASVAASQNRVRELAVAPANIAFPQSIAQKAQDLAKDLELEIKVLDEKDLAKEGFGLIAAVGMGSARPPRLVKLTYSPKNSPKHLALVGKGITFDSGGLAIKPRASMLGMKYDMTGAATVLYAIEAIATLKLPIKVTSYLCLAENMPSGSAMRPGDVFTARNGKTVEVTNPDAEGRLVLADGISAASEEHPDLIVDVATLTGAARVALGVRYTGLMGSAAGVAALEAAATDAGELVWEMPLAAELRAALDSPVADLQNSKVGSTFGGMLVGGWFIHEFVGNKKDGSKLEWAHLDIAGPADNEGSAYGYTPHGPTGVMLRTLVSLAQQMSAE